MESRRIEIDGKLFDLDDPVDKKASVKAWLLARSRERNARGRAGISGESVGGGAGVAPEDPPALDG